MRIAIIASGSRGDVEPYIALGTGLSKAGHIVRLVTHSNFEGLVNTYKLEFFPVDVNVQEIATSEDMRSRLNAGNFLSVMALMAREAERSAIILARAGLSACEGMDMIISGLGGLYPSIALAEKLNLLLVQAYYIPFTPTRAYPSFIIPRLPVKLNGSLNRLSYHLARQVFWQGFRLADNKVRRDEFDLPKVPFFGPYNKKSLTQGPILYGYSPSVLPKPADWLENIHVTGYWFLDHQEDWMPPEGLENFLQAGEPPVFIGFGSMSNLNPDQTTQLIIKALEISHQRGIILSGWGGLQTDRLPLNAFAVDSVPYSWLFPRTAAVVHHGGAGTTAAGLRAGVPSVVIPFFADQPFWGQRVAELGVGPAPIPQRKLTAEKLADAILTAVNDEVIRQRAAELGVKIQAEDGIAGAVTALEAVFGTVH